MTHGVNIKIEILQEQSFFFFRIKKIILKLNFLHRVRAHQQNTRQFHPEKFSEKFRLFNFE